MTISTYFQDEINVVDPTKTLIPVVNTSTYTEFEWSYNGLTVTGGSDFACECGASELLEAMGFRRYAPPAWAIKRPVSVPTNLTAAKQQFFMPANRIWYAYGQSWAGAFDAGFPNAPVSADRTTLDDSHEGWALLNNVFYDIYPAGHAWSGIVTRNLAFFQANLDLIQGGAIPGNIQTVQFNLANLARGGVRYNVLRDICAADTLANGLNAWNNANADPSDGNTHTSDQVWGFIEDTATRVRAGTPAIGIYGAQSGVATARLGGYAYADHSAPPSFTVGDEAYAGIALAFNRSGLTLLELITQYGTKTAFAMLREYGDVHLWFDSQPGLNSREKTGYFEDKYSGYQAAGAVGSSWEHGADWIKNLVFTRYGVRYMKTGNYTFAQARNEVVADLFGDDQAVHDLFDLWSDPNEGYHKWNLRRAFDLVAGMVNGAYKTRFEQYLVILRTHMKMPQALTTAQQNALPGGAGTDPFLTAYPDMMSKIVAVRLDEITHSYAWIRRNSAWGSNAVNSYYPSLFWTASPKPAWWKSPVAPTHNEFTTMHTELLAETVRDVVLDETDYVLVTGLTPTYAAGAASGAQDRYHTEGRNLFTFIGPGRVTHKQCTTNGVLVVGGEVLAEDYGPGLHNIPLLGQYLTTWEGGFLFLRCFSRVRMNNPGTTKWHWLYFPPRGAGLVDLDLITRVTIRDDVGQVQIYKPSDPSYTVPRTMSTGMVGVHPTLTTNEWTSLSTNVFVSPYPTMMLMPRTIAEEEFPARCVVNVVA